MRTHIHVRNYGKWHSCQSQIFHNIIKWNVKAFRSAFRSINIIMHYTIASESKNTFKRNLTNLDDDKIREQSENAYKRRRRRRKITINLDF